MRKIPTVLRRDPDDMSRVLDEVTPGCEWVLTDASAVATRKYDGTCVLIRRDGMAVHAFARREVKRGKPEPAGFQAVDHDPVTGKTVGWEPAEQSGYAKYIAEALSNAARGGEVMLPGTHELVGPKVQGNPEGYDEHRLVPHESAETVLIDSPKGPADLRAVIATVADAGWEGIVWHHPDGRMAKLKARDIR